MQSIRLLARSAPRTISRLSGLRQPLGRPLLQTTSISARLAAANRTSPFSTTVARSAADGETDDELSAKLESEIQIEEDMAASEQQPASIKDFLDNSAFELVDVPGQEVVKLVRNFGEEK